MIAVLVCSIVNSALILGLLGWIAAGIFRSRGAIVVALRDDAVSPQIRPRGAPPVCSAFA